MNDFIEVGYNPPSEVRDKFVDSGYPNPSSDTEIHFYKSESCIVPELQQAINATVLISESMDKPGGSGIIILHEGRKFLVTNHHVAGYQSDAERLYCFYRSSSGKVQQVNLGTLTRLVDSSIAKDRNVHSGDVALFEFEGDNEGVELSDDDLKPGSRKVAVASGFPGKFLDTVGTRPLLSVGYVSVLERKSESPYLKELIEKHEIEAPKTLPKMLFSGRIMRGNSGGPLIDRQGKVLGICRGPYGTLGKETGLEEFIDVRQAIKEVSILSI